MPSPSAIAPGTSPQPAQGVRAKAPATSAPRADEHGKEHREAPGPTEIRSQLVRTPP